MKEKWSLQESCITPFHSFMHFNGAKLLSIFDILILESISIKDYRHNSTTTSRVDDPGVFRGSDPDPDPDPVFS